MILSALASAALALSAPHTAANAPTTPQAVITALYAPFRQAAAQAPEWENPVYTPQLNALIAKWHAVTPTDEVDDLSDFDWLCQCQDWDPAGLNERITASRLLSRSRRIVTVALGPPSEQGPRLRFVMVRSGKRWLVDDIFASGFKGGLRATLIRTTAADIALRRKR